jgi:hypothetical protein
VKVVGLSVGFFERIVVGVEVGILVENFVVGLVVGFLVDDFEGTALGTPAASKKSTILMSKEKVKIMVR